MTPRSIITLILAIVVFCLGGGGGYLLGHWSGDQAVAALSAEATKQKLEAVSSQQLVQSLKDAQTAREKQYEADQTQLIANRAISDDNWRRQALLKDASLQSANDAATSAQVKLNALKAEMFLATMPPDKDALQKKIDQAQTVADTLQARVDGLKCLTTPIPEEYLALTNAMASPLPTPSAGAASGVSK